MGRSLSILSISVSKTLSPIFFFGSVFYFFSNLSYLFGCYLFQRRFFRHDFLSLFRYSLFVFLKILSLQFLVLSMKLDPKYLACLIQFAMQIVKLRFCPDVLSLGVDLHGTDQIQGHHTHGTLQKSRFAKGGWILRRLFKRLIRKKCHS